VPFVRDIDVNWRNQREVQRAPHVPSTGELAAREERRLARRAEIKLEIAKAQLADRRRVELKEAIEVINRKKETLANEHMLATAPIQHELSTIEAQQIAAITSRQSPVDRSLDERRKTLLKDVEGLNRDLEVAIEVEDRLLAKLWQDHYEAAKLCGTSGFQIELVHLARPDLKIISQVAESAVRWAGHRMNSAKERAGKFGGSDFAEAEIRAAESEVERCTEVAAKALQEILDE